MASAAPACQRSCQRSSASEWFASSGLRLASLRGRSRPRGGAQPALVAARRAFGGVSCNARIIRLSLCPVPCTPSHEADEGRRGRGSQSSSRDERLLSPRELCCTPCSAEADRRSTASASTSQSGSEGSAAAGSEGPGLVRPTWGSALVSMGARWGGPGLVSMGATWGPGVLLDDSPRGRLRPISAAVSERASISAAISSERVSDV